MSKSTELEICRKFLYADSDLIPVVNAERVKRIRSAHAMWYEYPTKQESEIREYLMNEFGIKRTTAFQDMETVKILLGDVQNAKKSWTQYQVNKMLFDAYKMAEEKKDVKAMIMAADKIGKYNQLDKPEANELPFDEIAVQPFEPTDDPTVLGLKKDPNIRETTRKMLEKYNSEIEIIDVPYEEMILKNNLE